MFARSYKPIVNCLILALLVNGVAAVGVAMPDHGGHDRGSAFAGLHHCADSGSSTDRVGAENEAAHDCCHVHASTLAALVGSSSAASHVLADIHRVGRRTHAEGRIADAPPLPPPNA